MVLAALSALGGLLLLGGWITDWLAPVVGAEVAATSSPLAGRSCSRLIVLAVVVAGIAIAWLTVGRGAVPRTAPTRVSVLTKAARADLYGDAINEGLFMRPGDQFVTGLVGLRRRRPSTGSWTARAARSAACRARSGGCRPATSAPTRSPSSVGAVLVVLALLAVNLA